jgi:tetratricopeptide (TPR) repeat protein
MEYDAIADALSRVNDETDVGARARFELGQALYASGLHDEALGAHRAAHNHFLALGPAYEAWAMRCDLEAGRILWWEFADLEAAMPFLGSAHEYFEGTGTVEEGMAAMVHGDALAAWMTPAAGLSDHERAVAVFRQLGDRPRLGTALRALGSLRNRMGENRRALEHHMEAREILQSVGGDPREIAGCENEIGLVATALGWYDEAVSHLERAYDGFHRHGNDVDLARARHNLAIALFRANRDLDRASRLLTQAAGDAMDTGQHIRSALALLSLAQVEWARGYRPDAIAAVDGAREVFADHDDTIGVADADDLAGHFLSQSGHHREAAAIHRRNRAIFKEFRETRRVADCDRRLGHALDHLGRHDEARKAILEARRSFTAWGRHIDAALCDQDLAFVYANLGKFSEAKKRLTIARKQFEEIGLPWDEARHAELVELFDRGEVERHEHA